MTTNTNDPAAGRPQAHSETSEKLLAAMKNAVAIICDSYDEDPEDLWHDSDCLAVKVLKRAIAEAG